MNGLVERVEEYIYENGLLEDIKTSNVVAGISGGADSVCLLLVLKRLSVSGLTAVHVNHNLRGDHALRDQNFVAGLCESLGVELKVFSEDVRGFAEKEGLSLEDAGRKIRYRLFADVASKNDSVIAVAHHLDDNAETILFNMIRGSGLKGLSGISPLSYVKGCKVIRPLLFASRAEIESFLACEGLTYCTDDTNFDPSYSRNRIRNTVITELKKINPKAAYNICKAAGQIAFADKYIEEQTEKAFLECALKEGQDFCKSIFPDACKVELDIKKLSRYDEIIKEGVIYKAVTLAAGKKTDISKVHIDDTARLIDLGTGKKVALPENVIALNDYGTLVIRKKAEDDMPDDDITINIPKDLKGDGPKSFVLPFGKEITFEIVSVDDKNRNELKKKNQCTKAFDYDRIQGDLSVGKKLPGEKILLKEGHKKISRYMIDNKISGPERDKTLILRDEEDVLWILGHRMSEKYKITEGTVRAMVVSIAEHN